MNPKTTAGLLKEFHNRARNCGENLAAEAAWLAAADLLQDAIKQERHLQKKPAIKKAKRK